jgi:hypothetical protein
MVACNAEEGEDSTTDTSSSRTRQSCTPRSYEQMMEYGWGCRETLPEEVRRDSSGSNNTSGGSTSGGSTSGVSRSANIARYAEYEPNNALDTANPVAFPSVSGDTVPGIKITGSVQDESDASDYFILTPNQSGTYLVYLCADTCTEQPTDSMVAISIIDQFGTVIVENPLFEESTKFLMANLDAGLPYYVQIIAFNTGEQAYPYELVIID